MREKFEQLISMFLQDPFAMTQEQSQQLSNWITQNSENTEEFIKASVFHRCIHDVLLNADKERNSILHDDINLSPFDRDLWEMLLMEEKNAPMVEIERPQEEQEQKEIVKPEKTERKPNKIPFITILTSAAALICMFIYVLYVTSAPKVEVATLTNMVNAKWAESAAPHSKNARLVTNHDPLMLREGYAELVFDNNAKVVLEAPVQFQVLSYDQIKLTYGRLYATVPKEAIGFIVSTPTSKIIDLGTEFGVKTDFNGTTELHVLKGRTSLCSLSHSKTASILLNAGSAKKIKEGDSSPVDIPCDKKMFVRQIDSKSKFVWRGQNLNLADIVGGGNGFGSGKLDEGIEPLTGNVIQFLPRKEVYLGPKNYTTVDFNPYIDGVFVPGVDSYASQITSLGLKVDDFGKTSGYVWGYIFDGAWHESNDTKRHNLKLDGVLLDGVQNPAITMHSNLGITFDLSAIRKKLPGIKIKSFSTKYGVSQTVEDRIKLRDFSDCQQSPELLKLKSERHSTVEFWVFLDGKKVLRQKLSSASKAGDIDIPINDDVRFLTLAVTEADDTFMFDWAVFSRPELILEEDYESHITN